MTAAANSLTAWIGDCAVGHLRFDAATGYFAFDYKDEWKRREGAYALR